MTFDDLTEGQKNAFNIVMRAIKEKKHHVTINGPAAVGRHDGRNERFPAG